MWYIILLVIVYAAGHGIYLYNNDAKIKSKCKGKWVGDIIIIIVDQVWENHKSWYNNSDLEDSVEDIKKDTVKVVSQVTVKASELLIDAKEEAAEVVAKAKAVVAKVAQVKSPLKDIKKPSASNSEHPKGWKVNKAMPSNSRTTVNHWEGEYPKGWKAKTAKKK